MEMEITEIETGRQILENKTDMPEFIFTLENETEDCLYENADDFNPNTGRTSFKSLEACEAFVWGVSWCIKKRIFGGYKT